MCNVIIVSSYGGFLIVIITTCFHAGAIALGEGLFSEENFPTLISSVNCSGTESELLNCYVSLGPGRSCGRFEDAVVVCQGNT